MNLRNTALSILITLPAIMAAKGDISGTILNKTDRAPMDFVNIQLIDASTGKALPIGTSSDENGSFMLKNIKNGRYIVRISNVGSIDIERDINIQNNDISLGEMLMAEDAKLLSEVVVEGVRSQMRFELDRKVFSVDSDIAAAGASASELLESIPSVEVDQDGEVSLRGNSSVTIWLNGKDSGLTADNRAAILEQIPAETIDRIEVITNPSAKYSPEGTAGIINIILKKNRRAGYFGSAELGVNSLGGGNAGVNFNYNSPKWDTYVSTNFRMRHNTGGSTMRRDFSDGSFLNSDGDSRNHGNNIFLRAGATYHLDDANSFSISGFGMFGHRWGRTSTIYSSNRPGQWIQNNEISRNRRDNRGAHAEISYSHKWNDSHTLDITGSYNHWGGPAWDTYYRGETYIDNNMISDYSEQNQNISVDSWEAKIDYVNQLAKWLKLEAGFNGNYNHENSPVEYMQGTSPENMSIRADLYNRFIYNNNISALYVTLGGRIKKFSFSAGLRGEAWQISTKSLGYGESESDRQWFRRNKFALFPSVFLSYSLPFDNEIQINYTRRIRRPWGGQLNSFRNVSQATEVSYGNPMLEPQYSNSFELNYIKNWTFHMISVSAYMRTSDNMINRISYMEDDMMYSTWANVANEINSGVEIVGKNNLFNRLDLTTTVNLYNNHIDSWTYTVGTLSGSHASLSGKAKNSFAWDARVMASVRLPWSLSLQATGRYASKVLTAQGSRNGGWSVDAGLRRVFGNWSVSLNCRNIFNSRKFESTIDGDDYHQWSKRWRAGRRLQLTVKYSFGNMKAKHDRRNITDENSFNGGYGGDAMD